MVTMKMILPEPPNDPENPRYALDLMKMKVDGTGGEKRGR